MAEAEWGGGWEGLEGAGELRVTAGSAGPEWSRPVFDPPASQESEQSLSTGQEREESGEEEEEETEEKRSDSEMETSSHGSLQSLPQLGNEAGQMGTKWKAGKEGERPTGVREAGVQLSRAEGGRLASGRAVGQRVGAPPVELLTLKLVSEWLATTRELAVEEEEQTGAARWQSLRVLGRLNAAFLRPARVAALAAGEGERAGEWRLEEKLGEALGLALASLPEEQSESDWAWELSRAVRERRGSVSLETLSTTMGALGRGLDCSEWEALWVLERLSEARPVSVVAAADVEHYFRQIQHYKAGESRNHPFIFLPQMVADGLVELREGRALFRRFSLAPPPALLPHDWTSLKLLSLLFESLWAMDSCRLGICESSPGRRWVATALASFGRVFLDPELRSEVVTGRRARLVLDASPRALCQLSLAAKYVSISPRRATAAAGRKLQRHIAGNALLNLAEAVEVLCGLASGFRLSVDVYRNFLEGLEEAGLLGREECGEVVARLRAPERLYGIHLFDELGRLRERVELTPEGDSLLPRAAIVAPSPVPRRSGEQSEAALVVLGEYLGGGKEAGASSRLSRVLAWLQGASSESLVGEKAGAVAALRSAVRAGGGLSRAAAGELLGLVGHEASIEGPELEAFLLSAQSRGFLSSSAVRRLLRRVPNPVSAITLRVLIDQINSAPDDF